MTSPPAAGLKIQDIRVFGELKDRIDRALDNILGWRKRKSSAKNQLYTNTTDYAWGADFQGRWTEVVSTWYPYFRWKNCGLQEIADLLIKGQQADGSFGKKNNYHIRFGNTRGIVGLLACYELTKDEACLNAAAKAGLWFYDKLLNKEKHPKKALFCGSPCSVLEGVVKLWTITGDKRFLDISTSMAERTMWNAGEFMSGNIVQTTMFLMSIRGLYDLYQRTGKKAYLNTVLKVWKAVNEKEVWLSGGIPEFFTLANDQVDEACGSADWMRLNMALWRDTKDAKYMDAVERTIYNQIYMNQVPNGGMSGSCNLEQGFRASEAWFCCSTHVPMALAHFVRSAYTCDKGTLYVNQFFANRAKVAMAGDNKVLIRQETSYPRNGKVRIKISPQSPARFTLAIRLPKWLEGKKPAVRINGRKPGSLVVRKRYLRIERWWKDGDIVDLEFPFAMRAEISTSGRHLPLGKVSLNNSRPTKAKLIGVFHGPLLLAVFRPDHNNDITWIYRGGYNEVQESGGMYGRWNKSWRDAIQCGAKQYRSKKPVRLTNVSVKANQVTLRWQLPLDDKALIENEVRVFPGLPVSIEHKESILIHKQPRTPLKEAFVAGSRLAVRKEQSHDHYRGKMGIFRYEYPAAKPEAKINNAKVLTGRETKVANGRVRYTFSNGLFCIKAACQGDIEAVKLIREKDWVGIYLRPKFSETETSKGKVATIVTKTSYPFPEFRDRLWAGKESGYDSDVTIQWGGI